MTLEWIDPPRDYRDEAADIARELRRHPGQWALVKRKVSGASIGYGHDDTNELLVDLGIETRYVTVDGLRGTYGESGDLYARAPKETE